ncbi:MAG TPA: hypothetical protein VGK74_24570 [Symbiobacteriaceae bacterium]|jgi:hypothetical protein
MTGEHTFGSQPSANQPIRLSQVAEPICIGAPVISGAGSDEVLERVVIAIPPLLAAAAALLPVGALTVVEVVVLSKKIIPQRCTIMNNKAIVDAILHKDLLFKIAAPAVVATGVVTSGDCAATIAVTLDVVLDCPFGICVPVPGACPGDLCQVNFCIEAEQENLIAPTPGATPTLFEEKVCVRADVTAIRQMPITITPTLPTICPPGPAVTPCPTPQCTSTVGLPTSTLVASRPTILPGFGFGF